MESQLIAASWAVFEQEQIASFIARDDAAGLVKYASAHGGPSIFVRRPMAGQGSVLSLAARAGAVSVVRALLSPEMGANPNAHFTEANDIRCSAFQAFLDVCSAGDVGAGTTEILGMMMRAGADPLEDWVDFHNTEPRANFRIVFNETVCNLHFALAHLPDGLGVAFLDFLPEDARVAQKLNEYFRWSSIHPSDAHSGGRKDMFTAIQYAFAHHRVGVCKKLIFEFGVDVDSERLQSRTLLTYFSSVDRLPNPIVTMVINAGANPLKERAFGRMVLSRSKFVVNPEEPNSAAQAAALGDAIDLARRHARFRYCLRIIRAGESSPQSRFGPLCREIIDNLIDKLMPEGSLMSARRVAELYASRNPWFTSK